MKASAIAHPIQGLIKYHGLRDVGLRLPFHDSISVCTAPLATHTTVEFGHDKDEASFDGKEATGRDMERIMAVIDPLRALAKDAGGMRMRSMNNFQSNIGLGASASGFAALAVAATKALGLDMTLEEISAFARLGAGSASRAVTGGFSQWYAGEDGRSSHSVCLASSADLDMGILAVIVPAFKTTDVAHKVVTTSPFFKARLETVGESIRRMREAIASKDVVAIMRLAEMDTLVLHSITMTGEDQLLLWRPETLRIIAEVKEMRKEGYSTYFSIDTGATVYVNCPIDEIKETKTRLAGLGLPIIECTVGDAARIVHEHLF